MPPSDIAVSVRNLSKSYVIVRDQEKHITLAETLLHKIKNPLQRSPKDTFWALSDVSFDIKKGDVVGIIGRNGAGKSTLLKILSRITEPTQGEIEIRGRVGSLLEVGTGFHAELTGRENIFLNGAILGMRKTEIQKQLDAIVDFSGVEKFLDTPVKRYSSGMYVRLAFAVAAHLNPEILIIDEVLAVGDAEFQKKCLGKMKDVASHEGRTVLFVSHNMAAIETLCDKAVLLRKGAIESYGRTALVVSHYLSDASQSETGCFQLDDHPARERKYRPVIREIRLLGADGKTRTWFGSTDPLSVELVITPLGRIREPRVCIAIEDHLGRRIGTTASYFGVGHWPPQELPFVARCNFPRLGLGAGRYLISVSISDKVTGLLDSVDGAAWVEVEWDNAFRNGEPFHPVYGPVLIDATWDTTAANSRPARGPQSENYGGTLDPALGIK